MHLSLRTALGAAVLCLLAGCGPGRTSATADRAAPIELLNVSYDPTRELYRDINAAFAARYQADHGRPVSVKQSHGASGSQARAVIDGVDHLTIPDDLGYPVTGEPMGSVRRG